MIAAIAAAISLAASSIRAEDAARIFFIGNSLTDQIQYDRFAELAAAGGAPIVWGRPMIPGAPRSMLVWQGTKNNATDPSKFGTVILQEQE